MTKNVVVAFALKEEFAPWRRRHRFRTLSLAQHQTWVTSFGTTEVYVALAGAGAPDAGHLHDLTTQLKPCLGIVTGVGAGLKPEWRAGDLLVAQSVASPEGESRIYGDPSLIDLAVQCGAKPAPVLITLPGIARTMAEKVCLAGRGDAADMESWPLIQYWSDRGIPWLALRVILDPLEVPMTCDFEAALDAHGQVRITQILAQLVRRPQLLPDFVHLARNSRRGLRILARFLDQVFERLAS